MTANIYASRDIKNVVYWGFSSLAALRTLRPPCEQAQASLLEDERPHGTENSGPAETSSLPTARHVRGRGLHHHPAARQNTADLKHKRAKQRSGKSAETRRTNLPNQNCELSKMAMVLGHDILA